MITSAQLIENTGGDKGPVNTKGFPPEMREKSPFFNPTNAGLIGSQYRLAAKSHVCWLCGETIQPGEAYWRVFGKYAGRFYTVKHCRKTCEITWEVIEQNPQFWKYLHSESIPK